MRGNSSNSSHNASPQPPGQSSTLAQQQSVSPSSSSSTTSGTASDAMASYTQFFQSTRQANQRYVSPYAPLSPSAQTAAAPSSSESAITERHHDAMSSTCTDFSQQGQMVRELSNPAPSAVRNKSPAADALLGRVPNQLERQNLINALNERRFNTMVELRRVERIFANLGSADVRKPMTSAWLHYVNSNSLLTELRGLTRNYPFSSECIDEAKRRVHLDPASNRSWNYCWLVLTKIQCDDLIVIYAQLQSSRPDMWGGVQPTRTDKERLAKAFVDEWSTALAQLLRYWETAPVR